MTRLLATFLTILGAPGCGQPCSNPARINGDWLAHSSFGSPSAGTNTENHPLTDAPILAGTMPWSATFLGSTDEVKLTIGPNKHTAEYIEDTEDCDSFTLQFTDFFEVREVDEGGRVIGGTLHEFLYEAKLRYTGPRITGTFLYQDEWAGLVDDQLGSLTVLEANLTLTAEE